jgi:polar amino acid transport system ATP-binding protein
MTDAAVLRAIGVSKSFDSHPAVDDVSLSVSRGQTLCVLGPSGSGKTTLLRCLSLLERPDKGALFCDGKLLGYRRHGDRLYELPQRAVAEQRRDIGMVFQQFNLFPHMTAAENVSRAPRSVLGLSRSEAAERAMELLSRVGLSDKAGANPEQLSGGQQQRVAIARALAMRPKVLLFDEPTSALDAGMTTEVLDVIRDLVETGTTAIIVTHEIAFAADVSDRFLLLHAGRVVEEGPSQHLR